jgi:tetratricopeptide (TPR) repeat protein
MAKKILLMLMLPLLLGWHWFEPAARRNLKGIRAYQQGKFAEALQDFLSAKGIQPDAPELKHNTAATLYELKKYREAVDEFSRLDPGRLGLARAAFHYNLGNSYFRLGQYPEALEQYKQSLLLNSDDIDGKKNFELTLRRIEQQQPRSGAQQRQTAEPPPRRDEHDAMSRFLDQNERRQMEKKKRRTGTAKNEKDW